MRRLFDAVARRDTDAVLDAYDAEVEWDGTRSRWAQVIPDAHYQGHEGIRNFSRQYYEIWESIQDNVKDVIDAGEHVITVVSGKGRGRASGLEVEWTDHVGVWTLRDGKITRVVWF